MKPLELRLSGFRSYRAERTVDLRDLDLVAIIGDTGSGKSSILEAMVWALYGASTWSKKISSDLLAHGARQMTVRLEFEARDERWQLTRAFRAVGAGSAELRCLSNDSIATVDGVRQVNPAVENLLGLSYEVFCSCVLLPQGRFEKLLVAPPAEKTETLKSILRLERLGHARALADQKARLVAERERELLEAKVRFRADPRADAAAAVERLKVAEPRRKELVAVETAVAKATEASVEAAGAAASASEEMGRLEARRGTWPTRLAALVESAKEIGAARTKADEALVQRQAEIAELDAAQDAAVADGRDRVSLAHQCGQLDRARTAFGNRSRLAAQIEAHEGEITEETVQRDAAREAEQAAAAHLEQHDQAAAQLAEAVTTAADRRETADTIADQLSAMRDGITEHEHALLGKEGELARAAEELQAATGRRDEEAGAVQAAESQRDALQRADAVAHAATGCGPGDSCPVCRRSLPADFVALAAPGMSEAEAAVVAAREILAAANDAQRAAELAHAGARQDVERLTLELSGCREAELENARVAVAHLELGEDVTDVQAAITATLTAATEEESAARARAQDHEKTRVALAEAATTAAREAGEAAGAVEVRKAQITAARDGLVALVGELEEAAGSLGGYRGEVGASEELSERDLTHIAAAIGRLEDEAKTLEEERGKARKAVSDAQAAVAVSKDRLLAEVITPATEARSMLTTLADELPVADRPEASAPPPEADLSPLLAWAQDLDHRTTARITQLSKAQKDAEGLHAQHDATAKETIAQGGFANLGDLKGQLDVARAEIISASNEKAAAEREIPSVTRLDEMITRAGALKAQLEALRDALRDGAFVGFVVRERQRALLAHASRTLEQITKRYAFTDDFRILDQESNAPRSPETLSGGETFIASLALALGLVEVADRAGGDLRALFLDEGFGTLDATILDTALTALEERARAGRLIGLISHVPTVAERIPTVLEVRSAVDGSTVTRLTADERESRLLDDAAQVVGEVR